MSDRLRSYLLLTVNTLVWGAGLVIVKPALAITTPFRFLLYRLTIAALLATPILFYFFLKKKNLLKHLPIIIGLELIGTTLALSLLYTGLRITTAIEASLITSSTPVFISILGVIFLKEKEEVHELIGTGLAFLGALLLTLFPVFQGHTQLNGVSLTGNLLIVGQNLATASYFILAKKYYQKIPKFFVTSISFYLGIITFFGLSLWTANWQLPKFFMQIQQDLTNWSVWRASGYMAIFGSIIGLTTYIKGQEKIEASEAALFSYLQPLVYIPLGVLWLGEKIYWWQLASLALILFGVFWAERRVKE